MRYVTFHFDDGFRRSSIATAEVFEARGLRAEFFVLTDATWPGLGDFRLWRELRARGHSIQPHGTDHTDKSKIPHEEAQRKILRCLDRFAEEFDGFEPREAIYGFPYNASTNWLEGWLPSFVGAMRTSGDAINPLPEPYTAYLTTMGWEDAEPNLTRCIDELLAQDSGWLIYNAHGLDGEGWGPLRRSFLEATLDRLLATPGVEVVTAVELLASLREPGERMG